MTDTMPDNLFATRTTDAALCQQYYDLRNQEYKKLLGFSRDLSKQNIYDNLSHIFVVMEEDRVVAGARLTISTAERRILLPMERDTGLKICELVSELDVEEKSYCEINRFVVDEQHRNGHTNYLISKKIIEFAKEQGCCYQFSIAPLAVALQSKRIARRFGDNHIIRKDIVIPPPEDYQNLNDIDVFLCITELH